MQLKQLFTLLSPFLKKHYNILWQGFFFGAISSFGTIFLSYLTGHIINQLISSKGNIDVIIPNLITFLITIIITCLCLFTSQKKTYQLSYLIIEDLRITTLDSLNRTNFQTFKNFQQGNLLSRLTNDVENVATSLYQITSTLFIGLPTLIVASIMMFYMSISLSIVVICLTPLIFLFMTIVVKRSQSPTKKQQEIMGTLTDFANEYLSQQKLVKNLEQTSKINQEFQNINQKLYTVGYKTQFISSLTNPLSRFVDHLTYASIGLIGGLLFYWQNNHAMIGLISSFTLYAGQFSKPFIELSGLTNQIQLAYVGLKRNLDIINLPKEHHHNGQPLIINQKPILQFENVDFGYDQKQLIIKNFNLTIHQNQTVALVGPTGSGKSTIINLILRFNEINKGNLKLYDQDVYSIDLNQYREMFGLVLQNTWLYEDTIYNNICFGLTNVSNQQFQNVCYLMNLTNIINKLPNKENTLLSEAQLAQGEKQLLTIARAYLRNPKILILDEATSSLDFLTEQMVKKALNQLMKNRICIIVAHHLDTIKHADQIVVLDKGHIVEQGTHQQLIDNNNMYAKLWTKQFM